MNSWFGVDPVLPAWAIVALVLPFFGFCVYKEFTRRQKFLIGRVLALTFLKVAVLGIILRPSVPSGEKPHPTILLTPGYDKIRVDSLVTSDPDVQVFATTDAATYTGATVIPVNAAGTLSNLSIVFGNGLPSDVLDLLPSHGFRFLPSHKPRGITLVDIPKTIRPHESAAISGIANVDSGTLLSLVGPGGTEDSMRMNSKSQEFTLRFKPRQTGLFLYSIVIKDKSMIKAGNIPVEVKPENKLKILFLQKFPTAETRALKNYLTEKGHAIALRYQVSKTNFKYEYANLPPQALGRLTPELLSSFDLLFLDNYLFEEIGEDEKSAIGSSIRNGLGVILFVDKLSGKSNMINTLLPVKGRKSLVDTVHLSLPRSRSYTFPAVPIEIESTPELQPVLQTKDRILSAYVYSGFGKIGFQLLRETYRISLEGNSDDYAFLWRDLIERTARMKQSRFKFVLNGTFPYTVNESVALDMLSDGTQPSLLADRTFVPMEEDVLLDDYWHTKIWATTPGWHSFTLKNDSSALHYFVSDTTQWKALRQTRQRYANELFSAEAKTPVTTIPKSQTVNPLLWYALFLLSAGFLWLAPKL